MKRASGFFLVFSLMASFATQVNAQKTTAPPKVGAAGAPKSTMNESERPLVLTEAVPLQGVKGRFDHFGFGGGRLFVAELGNNSVGVITTGGRALEKTITGVPDPQGVVFSPDANKLFVARTHLALLTSSWKGSDASGDTD